LQKILVFIVLAYSICGWSQTSQAQTQGSGLNGLWEGVIVTFEGDEYVRKFTFMVDGTTLTGTVKSGNVTKDIYDGKVYGNDFGFSVDESGVAVLFSGTLSGDTIQMYIDYQGMKFPATLKRSADTPLAAPPATLGEP
jgi:hypothetical protein